MASNEPADETEEVAPPSGDGGSQPLAGNAYAAKEEELRVALQQLTTEAESARALLVELTKIWNVRRPSGG